MRHWTFIKRRKGLLLAAPVALMLLLLGCYPEQPEFVEEYDIVYTNYAPDFNFANDYTFSLPDSVLLLDDSRRPEDPPEFIDDTFGDAILATIRQNLTAEGWTEVDDEVDADLVVLPSAFETQFLYFYDPGYWCWYYPCFGWGGWWYPGYNPGYVTGYKTGTVLIQITDPNGVENDEVPVVWTGALNGLLQGSDANIVGRIDRNLDQAFTQPPFD